MVRVNSAIVRRTFGHSARAMIRHSSGDRSATTTGRARIRGAETVRGGGSSPKNPPTAFACDMAPL